MSSSNILGTAFNEIAEAHYAKKAAERKAFASGNHWGLPTGTYMHGTTKIIKSPNRIQYEPESGHCCGYAKNGGLYTYIW